MENVRSSDAISHSTIFTEISGHQLRCWKITIRIVFHACFSDFVTWQDGAVFSSTASQNCPAICPSRRRRRWNNPESGFQTIDFIVAVTDRKAKFVGFRGRQFLRLLMKIIKLRIRSFSPYHKFVCEWLSFVNTSISLSNQTLKFPRWTGHNSQMCLSHIVRFFLRKVGRFIKTVVPAFVV